MEKLGKFRIDGRLGVGGMGVVYKAWDTVLERPVALKTILPELSADPELKARLVREAKAAAQLQHPNVVTVYDFGESEGGQLYIAMEYIAGSPLGQASSEMPLEQKIAVMTQVGQALEYAHRLGIVHRDVKPSNILVTEDGSARLLDFGIAHLVDSQLTRSGVTLGTPDYMSPELVEGRALDARSDIFSCGVVLYELITENRPFHHERLTTIIYRIIHHQPPPVSDLVSGVPAELESIVARMLAKKPEDRYQNMREVVDELERLQSRTVVLKSSHAMRLGGVFDDIRTRIEGLDAAARGEAEKQFSDRLAEARLRVRRLCRPSDPSVSREMIEKEIGNLNAFRQELEEFVTRTLPRRLKATKQDTNTVTTPTVPEWPTTVPPKPPTVKAPTTPLETWAPAPILGRKGIRALLALAGAVVLVVIGLFVFPLENAAVNSPQNSTASAGEVPLDPSDNQAADTQNGGNIGSGLPNGDEAKSGADDTSLSDDPAEKQSPPTIDWAARLESAYRSRRADQALEAANQLERSGSVNRRTQLIKGWALVQTGSPQDALAHLERAAQDAKLQGEAQFLLGEAYQTLGDEGRSKSSWLSALANQALAADRRELVRQRLADASFSFPALHLHDRRRPSLLGGEDSCPGTLELRGRVIRFLADSGSHSRSLAFAILDSIQLSERTVALQRRGGSDFVFELDDLSAASQVAEWLARVQDLRSQTSSDGMVSFSLE